MTLCDLAASLSSASQASPFDLMPHKVYALADYGYQNEERFGSQNEAACVSLLICWVTNLVGNLCQACDGTSDAEGNLCHAVEVECLGAVGHSVVVWIPEERSIGQHQRRISLLPK